MCSSLFDYVAHRDNSRHDSSEPIVPHDHPQREEDLFLARDSQPPGIDLVAWAALSTAPSIRCDDDATQIKIGFSNYFGSGNFGPPFGNWEFRNFNFQSAPQSRSRRFAIKKSVWPPDRTSKKGRLERPRLLCRGDVYLGFGERSPQYRSTAILDPNWP